MKKQQFGESPKGALVLRQREDVARSGRRKEIMENMCKPGTEVKSQPVNPLLSIMREFPTFLQQGFMAGDLDPYVNKSPIQDPQICHTCGQQKPEPEWRTTGNRRLLNREWIVWYALNNGLTIGDAKQAGIQKVIEAEFGEKSRWRVTGYFDDQEPLLVRIKYNDE